MKTVLPVLFYGVQASILLVAGFATLWWSDSLMTWLIYMVGEERALGAENVVYTENGGKLLTNPAGMMVWTLPFWGLGAVQVLAGMTLFCDLRYRLRNHQVNSSTIAE